MKQKDIMFLILAVAIFLVAGYVGYTQLVPQRQTKKTVTVETAGKISADLDSSNVLAKLKDPTQVVDYNSPIDLNHLDNTSPFGR